MQRIKQDRMFGQNIRKLRVKSGMTQEQVAAKLQLAGCEMSRSIYAQIEAGTYNIRVSELAELKRLFKVNYADFFEGIQRSARIAPALKQTILQSLYTLH